MSRQEIKDINGINQDYLKDSEEWDDFEGNDLPLAGRYNYTINGLEKAKNIEEKIALLETDLTMRNIFLWGELRSRKRITDNSVEGINFTQKMDLFRLGVNFKRFVKQYNISLLDKAESFKAGNDECFELYGILIVEHLKAFSGHEYDEENIGILSELLFNSALKGDVEMLESAFDLEFLSDEVRNKARDLAIEMVCNSENEEALITIAKITPEENLTTDQTIKLWTYAAAQELVKSNIEGYMLRDLGLCL